MAESCDENSKLLCCLIIVTKQIVKFNHRLFIDIFRKNPMSSIIDDRRCATVVNEVKNIGDQTLFLFLQNTNCHETVEPSIGNLFVDVLYSLLFNSIIKRHPLMVEVCARNDTTIEVGIVMCQHRHLLKNDLTLSIETEC